MPRLLSLLYDLLKGNGKDSDTVCMEELHLKAFNDLKRALCQAPALGIAQSDRPFVLYVHEHLGFMTACLMQDHGGSLRPIHYYSGKLDIVAQGMGPCLRAVQAVHLALQASSGMVLGQTVNVKMPSHSVRTNESSKSHFCHILPLEKLVSNSHRPRILLYSVHQSRTHPHV